MSLREQIAELDARMREATKEYEQDDANRLILMTTLNLYQAELMTILYCHLADPQFVSADVPDVEGETVDDGDKTVVLNVGSN